jgi:cell division protein FtsI/penicillin-binding protein 2
MVLSLWAVLLCFTIRTWNNKYYENTTLKDVIVHSDNTGMVFVANKLGLDKFYSYIENFGFGKPTNIDLEDESVPDIREKSDWREIDLATASFGQGIAVTPIQMVRAVAAIANGGNLMEPHVVGKIVDEKGTYEIKPKVIRRVLKEPAAQLVKEMMVAAVDEGEAKVFKPKGFKVAGKTGTAQIPVAGHYDPNKTIASFVGFAPADDPKFVMLVRYDQPSSSIYGAETAAPTFFEIAKQLFPYFKIAPSE